MYFPYLNPTQITSATSFEQRDYVIRELIDTESNYLDVLNALKTKFMAPLERYLNPEEIKLIFPRIRVSLYHICYKNILLQQILKHSAAGTR